MKQTRCPSRSLPFFCQSVVPSGLLFNAMGKAFELRPLVSKRRSPSPQQTRQRHGCAPNWEDSVGGRGNNGIFGLCLWVFLFLSFFLQFLGICWVFSSLLLLAGWRAAVSVFCFVSVSSTMSATMSSSINQKALCPTRWTDLSFKGGCRVNEFGSFSSEHQLNHSQGISEHPIQQLFWVSKTNIPNKWSSTLRLLPKSTATPHSKKQISTPP